MITLHIVLGLLFAPLVQILWSYIHETSHALVIKRLRPSAQVTIKPYPHRAADGRWVGGLVRWKGFKNELTPVQLAWVSIAPRIPDLIACILAAVCAWVLVGHWAYIPVFILLGGVIDLAYGSIGKTERSDLQRVARGWDISPWLLRLSGWSVALLTVTLILLGFLT
jgi:hypothetical protein